AFERPTDPELVAGALRQALEVHPILAAHFDAETMDMGIDRPQVESIAGRDPIDALKAWIAARPAALSQGELACAVVVKCPEMTAFGIVSHRAVADARSLELLLAEACWALAPSDRAASVRTEVTSELGGLSADTVTDAAARARRCLEGV